MAKLPDFTDVSSPNFAPARPFVPVPTADLSGIQQAGRAIAQAGEALDAMAEKQKVERQNDQLFNAKLGLADAKVKYDAEVQKLDPLADDYPDKAKSLYDSIVQPIVTGVADPETRKKIGQEALIDRVTNGAAATKQQTDLRQADETLKLTKYGETIQKSLREGKDIDTVRKDFTETVNAAKYMTPIQKRDLLEKTLPVFDKEHVLSTAKEIASGEHIPLVTANQPGRVSKGSLEGLNPQLIDRFQKVQDAFGKSIPIVSGHRDAATNAKAGGAKSSQHLHGNAIDLDVSGLSTDERRKLIETASANGITGIGVYKNSIHFDLGGRRVWGPSHHADSVPGWAYQATARHVAGKSRPLGALPKTADSLWQRQIMAESGGKQSARSPVGAVGIAQVMPATGPEAAKLAGLPWDEKRFREDATYNEALGRAYMDKQLKDFGGDPVKALAAYNAGPGATRAAIAKYGESWMQHMPAETRGYVDKIMYGGSEAAAAANVKAGFNPQLTEDYVAYIKGLPSFQRLDPTEQEATLKAVQDTYGKTKKEEQDAYELALSQEITGSANGDRKVAVDMAKQIADPETRKNVLALTDTYYKREEELQKQQQNDAYDASYRQVFDALQAGDQQQAISIAKSAKGLTAEDQDKLLKRAMEGVVTKDDNATKDKLFSLFVNDEQAFLKATERMADYDGKLTMETQLAMKARREKIIGAASGDKEATEIRRVVSSASSKIDDRLREIGVNPSAKAGEDDNRYTNFVRSVATQELERFAAERAKQGKPILDSEVDDVVRSVFKSYPRAKAKGGWFFGWGADENVDIVEVSKEFNSAGYDINQAADALRRKGKMVNAATLLDLLERKKAADGAN